MLCRQCACHSLLTSRNPSCLTLPLPCIPSYKQAISLDRQQQQQQQQLQSVAGSLSCLPRRTAATAQTSTAARKCTSELSPFNFTTPGTPQNMGSIQSSATALGDAAAPAVCSTPSTANLDRASTLPAGSGQALANTLLKKNARCDIAAILPQHYADVGPWTTEHQLPMVYSDLYNITFFGIEKLHPFDACKFRKILAALEKAGSLTRAQTVTPLEASRELLTDVHDPEYVRQVHSSNLKIVQVTELAPLLMLPNRMLQWKVIRPMKHHVAGTVLAAGLAMQHGWAINLGGGMHHASSDDGSGWCPFDDIYLALRRLRTASQGRIKQAMLVDLDAHQGNGIERDKQMFNDPDFFIVDMYNGSAFPHDEKAKHAIDVAVELAPYTDGPTYLASLDKALHQAQSACPNPDVLFYNAGTDILENDPLGRLSVSRQHVLERDQKVWSFAQSLGCPIVMTLSGGYSPESAGVTAESIAQLFSTFGLGEKAAA